MQNGRKYLKKLCSYTVYNTHSRCATNLGFYRGFPTGFPLCSLGTQNWDALEQLLLTLHPKNALKMSLPNFAILSQKTLTFLKVSLNRIQGTWEDIVITVTFFLSFPLLFYLLFANCKPSLESEKSTTDILNPGDTLLKN